MKRFILIALLALGLGFGLTLMASTPSMAVHKGTGNLTCGSCHTMHSSQGGSYAPSMGGANGAMILLRNANVTSRADVHNLCLQCHSYNGTQATVQFNQGGVAAGYKSNNSPTTPPKVDLEGSGSTWNDGLDFTSIGAGGDFQYIGSYTSGVFTSTDGGTALGRGHSIGGTNISPPGNGSTLGTPIATFSCTTCHDPHGADVTTTAINKFRNLKGNIGTTGVQRPWTNMTDNIGTSYVGGMAGGDNSQGTLIAGQGNIWPVYRSSGTQNSYSAVAGSPTFTGGAWANQDDASANFVVLSAFCAQCHSSWHEGLTSGNKNANGTDWQRHPVNNQLVDLSTGSGAGVTIVDFTHYSDNAVVPIGKRLPAAQNDGGTTYYANTNNDKVFCLSCHFAHGSPYYDILRWDYISAVEATGGSQTGNGVASNKGCQQCHNR